MDELRAAAEVIVNQDWADQTGGYGILETHAMRLAREWLAEHLADDAERATPDWLEVAGLSNSLSSFRVEKRYEFCDGIRLVFHAGPWPELWKGEVWIGTKTVRPDPTRGDVRRLAAFLGMKLAGAAT